MTNKSQMTPRPMREVRQEADQFWMWAPGVKGWLLVYNTKNHYIREQFDDCPAIPIYPPEGFTNA